MSVLCGLEMPVESADMTLAATAHAYRALLEREGPISDLGEAPARLGDEGPLL